MAIISAHFDLPDTPALDEFNRWYSIRHVPDFVAAPGIAGGRRFYRAEGDRVHFVALYEHDGQRPARESFESPEGRGAVDDFVQRFPGLGMPDIKVFHEIVVGPDYAGWRQPPRRWNDEGQVPR